MATSVNSQYHFCLFCYKTIESSVETTERSKVIQTFINQLNNHVKNTKTDSLVFPTVLLKKITCVDNLLNCCYGCQDKVEGFCEKYQQLKTLEMELDWKLGQLMEEINYANILPTRWIHVDNVLEKSFQNDLERKCGSHNLIKKLRQFVVNAGNQKRKQARPRVLLQRDKKLDEEAVKIGQEAKVKEKALSEDELEQLYKTFPCSKCGKVLKTSKGLEYHLETHKDPSEWKFECPHCGKKLPTERELKGHIRVHTGEKPYDCTFCGMKYQIRSGLTYHLKNVHKDEEGLEEELRKRFSFKSGSTLKESTTLSDDYIKTECIEDVDSTNVETENQIIDDLLIQVKAEYSDSDTCDNIEDVLGLQPLENIDEDGYENEKRSIGFQCPKCEKSFPRNYILMNHLETHKSPNEWKYKCTECNRKFANQRHLKYHMEIHEQKRYHCPYCPTQFGRMRNLRRHINSKHSNQSNRKKINKIATYPSAKRQVEEIPTTEPAIKVEQVETEKRQPEAHILTSGGTSTTALECEICRRKLTSLLMKEHHFARNHDLKGDRTRKIVKCTELGCTAYFLQDYQLRVHRKLEHGEKTGQVETRKCTKRFGCPVCWRFYPNKNQFQLHMESHKDPSEWKFECKTCTRKFSRDHHLKLHMSTHTKEQKFECKFCGNKYKYANSLRVHMQNSHRDQEGVKAEIAVKENKKKEAKTSDEIEIIEVKEVKTSNEIEIEIIEVKEDCGLDIVEFVEVENVEIMDNDLVETDGNERNNVNDVAIDEVLVVEDGNILGDDGTFVNLEDIY